MGRSLAKPVKGTLGFQLLPWHPCHLLAAETICIIYRHQKPNRLSTNVHGILQET